MRLVNTQTGIEKDIGHNAIVLENGWVSWFNAKGIWEDIADYYPKYAWKEVKE